MKTTLYVIIRLVGAIFLAAQLSACAMAWGRHEMLPTVQVGGTSGPQTQTVELYRQGEMPRKQVFRIALVAVHGNGYVTLETLEQTLRDEAAKIGADCVIVTG